MNSGILRAFVAIVAGALMIYYRSQMVVWLTVALGVMFFLSGIISVVYYFVMLRKAQANVLPQFGNEQDSKSVAIVKPTFPLVGAGSIILGAMLALMPEKVTEYFVYIFAGILILGAVGQYFTLLSAISHIREFEKTTGTSLGVKCGIGFWVVPSLILIFGIVSILYTELIISAPFLFHGIGMVCYGLTEFVNSVKYASVKKAVQRQQIVDVVRNDNDISDAEIVEEENPSVPSAADETTYGANI